MTRKKRLRTPKAKAGEIWTYGNTLAAVVETTILDVAPQCHVLLKSDRSRPRRPLGIMERELGQLVGHFDPFVFSGAKS